MSEALRAVEIELGRARAKHGPILSFHEAIGVIREEYLEAEREAFQQRVDKPALGDELLHLATMCIRAIEDLDLWAAEWGR